MIETVNWLCNIVRLHADTEGQVNLIDVIARTKGWLPLVIGEEMTVHYQEREYVIRRTE